jgi:hypothetical protein
MTRKIINPEKDFALYQRMARKDPADFGISAIYMGQLFIKMSIGLLAVMVCAGMEGAETGIMAVPNQLACAAFVFGSFLFRPLTVWGILFGIFCAFIMGGFLLTGETEVWYVCFILALIGVARIATGRTATYFYHIRRGDFMRAQPEYRETIDF